MSVLSSVLRPSTRPGLCSAPRQAPGLWSSFTRTPWLSRPSRNKTVFGRFRLATVGDASRVSGTPSLSKAVWSSSKGQTSGTFSKAVGCTLGDVVAQSLSGEAANAFHSLQLGIYGTLLDAPHVPALETPASIIPLSHKHGAPARRPPASADPMWTPAIVCLIAALIKLLSGQSDLILSSCQDKLLSLAAANYILWPLTCYVNANVVPKQHQAKSNLIIHMIWSACLSGLGHAPCITSLPIPEPVSHVGQIAVDVMTQIMPQQAASAAALALQTAASNVLSPVAECAAGAIEIAVRKLETLPSTLTQEAISKSLNVIMNVEEMAKSPLHVDTGKLAKA